MQEDILMSDHLMLATPLPDILRGLRIGQDDEARIRRVAHLAAAKIEDLQLQVSTLMAELERVELERIGTRSTTENPVATS
jgi:hypothetical protein